MLITAWFRFSYRDPKISLLRKMFLPSCNQMAKVVNLLGIWIDLEQKINLDNQQVKKAMCSMSETSVVEVS
jgi:hypothetical protein